MDILHKKIRSLTLKQIAYAVATADVGNVSEAARRLNVSQPAISSAIQALEALFGHRLFTRRPGQGVVPTSFGATVMIEARELLSQVENFSSLGDPAEAPRGQVVLCCYRILGPHILPCLLKRLAKDVPSVTVRFLETDLQEIPERLYQDNADIAITYDLGLDAELDTRTLYATKPHVLCASDHRFARRGSVALADLRDEPMVVLDQPLSAQHLLGLLKGHGVEPKVAARVSELELQRAMIANGFGVGVSYTIPKTDMSYDGRPVVTLPIADDLPAERVLLVRMAQSRYHPAVAAVYRSILTHFEHEARSA